MQWLNLPKHPEPPRDFDQQTRASRGTGLGVEAGDLQSVCYGQFASSLQEVSHSRCMIFFKFFYVVFYVYVIYAIIIVFPQRAILDIYVFLHDRG